MTEAGMGPELQSEAGVKTLEGLMEECVERKIQLSLSPRYVSKWGLWEALRELLQNALDQHKRGFDMWVDYRAIPTGQYSELAIGTKEVCLTPQTLLLGESDKTDDKKLIGQFGEGYKLAMLVLTRLGKIVTVYTGSQIWECGFADSPVYGTKVFEITIKENPNGPMAGTEFRVGPISKAEWEYVQTRYIPDCNYSKLLEDKEPGMIYVGGLYICTLDKFRHAYNFSPELLRLDRDRNMVAEFDISWHASQIWGRSDVSVKELYEGLESDAPDTKYVAYSHTLADTSKTAIFNHYISTVGEDVIPVHNQQQINEAQGRRFKLVPETLCNILRSMRSWIMPKDPPKVRLQKLIDAHGKKLPKYLVRELESIVKEMQ